MRKIIYTAGIAFILLVVAGCSLNNVSVDKDMEPYFTQNGLKGSFAILDNVHGTFTVFDLAQYKDSSLAPGSTFDVLNALIGIEIGRVNDQNSPIKVSPDSAVSVASAFKVSGSPAFKVLASEIGKDTLQYWLDSLHYGNKVITNADSSFWTNNTLKITPDEQLGFIEKVYFMSLPFQQRTQEMVRNMMITENNTLYAFACKSTWDTLPDGRIQAWAVGWIEENRHVYFYVLSGNPINATANAGSPQKAAKEILRHYGFFQGKK